MDQIGLGMDQKGLRIDIKGYGVFVPNIPVLLRILFAEFGGIPLPPFADNIFDRYNFSDFEGNSSRFPYCVLSYFSLVNLCKAPPPLYGRNPQNSIGKAPLEASLF